jgi:hypothetical protein
VREMAANSNMSFEPSRGQYVIARISIKEVVRNSPSFRAILALAESPGDSPGALTPEAYPVLKRFDRLPLYLLTSQSQ